MQWHNRRNGIHSVSLGATGHERQQDMKEQQDIKEKSKATSVLGALIGVVALVPN